MAETCRDYTIQALHHALKVLETFLDANTNEQGVTEISAALGLNKSRVFRILSTLEQHGFVEQNLDSKRYRLGLRLLAYSEAVHRRLNVVHTADPVLDQLAEQSGETVHMGVVDGHEAVCVAKRESKHSVRLYAQVGKRAPLHAGGVPKVLLAHMSTEERQRIIRDNGLPRFTDNTITDPAALEEALAQIRQDGYVVAEQDLEPGAHSIAAPIRDHGGRVVAALSVAGPSQRFSTQDIQRFVRLVCDAADQISQRLGYRP
ncbi:MAG: IclR family transcriptional regulator [Chloroflexota bacterium]